MALLESVQPGSTFWMVGDQSLLSQPAAGHSRRGGGGTGHAACRRSSSWWSPATSIPWSRSRPPAKPPTPPRPRTWPTWSAGSWPWPPLQASQKPELKQLASAVSVTTDANRVRVTARFPYELLESLQPKKRGVAAASPGQ